MKKLKVILIVIWISVLLMILISANIPGPVTQNQDTIKQDSIKKKTEVKITIIQKKQMEQRQIMKGFDESNDKIDKQLMHLDSLMGKKDTTKIKK